MIASLALAARAILSAVLATAGVAKLADRSGTREAVGAFGAPAVLAGPLALLLPPAELAVAVLLLPASTAVAGAAAALALLLVFTAAIGVNLARGRAPDCHCFGQLHSSPAGWKTLARNGVLAAVAVLALVGGLVRERLSALAWVGRLGDTVALALAAGVAFAALLALGAFAFITLVRSYGRVLVRLERVEQLLAADGYELDASADEPEHGLEPGTPAPAPERLAPLLEAGHPLLIAFTSPRCGPCQALLPRIASWQRIHAGKLTIAVAVAGTAQERDAEVSEFELANVLDDEQLELYNAFAASGTPGAVLVSADGEIASWVATGSDAIERLLARAVAPPPAEPGLPVGAEAPELELPSLDGGDIALADLAGREALLLFWNPSCGFCRSMHDDVLALERSTNGDRRLVVVSSGDAAAVRDEGFSSLVLLDEGYAAGRAFGATGTPMAVLLGADGRVASRVAGGAESVLALARSGAVLQTV